jgi:carbonic anhydrase
MTEGKFATVITCMDGRVQEPVSSWMKKHLKVDFIDTITEPGPDKFVTQGNKRQLESLNKKLGISISLHHSSNVAVVAHHDCGGNPVSKEEHLKQLADAVDLLASWKLPVRILGLWVDESWQVQLMHDEPWK